MNMETTLTEPRTVRSRVVRAVLSLTLMQRLALAVSSLMVAFGLTGAGLYATFTTSATASHSASTATLSLTLGTTNTAGNRLTLNASGLVPSDSYYRSFSLTNGGSSALSAITLTSTATTSSLLDTDATNGLQMQISRCSVAWTETGVSPNFTYSCSGTSTVVLASRRVTGSSIALANLTATAPAATDQLLLTVSLPTAADDTFQGLTSTMSFSFNGV